MRNDARLVCLFSLLAAPAAAQSTTEDGIRAMLRGDYGSALHILRPLADDIARPDPAAQFFLGVLYDTGHANDGTRACGLFLRVAESSSPFAAQAAARAAVIREQLGSAAALFCIADEGWQGGPAQSFVLGPGHKIVFTDTSVRVTYNDQEQSTTMLPTPGVMFLPIQYTPLNVTKPEAARRHFLQWFVWTPDTTTHPSAWTLRWVLSEVVDDAWIAITSDILTVVKGTAQPPPVDLSALVRLRVNANGEAEFTITSGDSPRTESVPLKGTR